MGEADGTPDVIASNDGTLWVFECVTQGARDWAHENVNVPDYLWLGPASLGRFAVEHRFAGQLVEGFAEAGFRVRVE